MSAPLRSSERPWRGFSGATGQASDTSFSDGPLWAISSAVNRQQELERTFAFNEGCWPQRILQSDEGGNREAGDGSRAEPAGRGGSASGGGSRSREFLAFGGGGDTSAAGGRIRGKRGAGGAAAVDRPVAAAWPRVAAAARPSAVEAGIVGPAAAWDSDVAGAFSWVHSSRRVETAVFFFQSLPRRSIFFGKNLQ